MGMKRELFKSSLPFSGHVRPDSNFVELICTHLTQKLVQISPNELK